MQPQDHGPALLERVHSGADIRAHAEILFAGMQLAGGPFLPLCRECFNATRTSPRAWKIFRRVQRAYYLARYVEQAAALGGAMAECGVFQGFSALLACKVRAQLDSGFDGRDVFLCDSYEGLSDPRPEDMIDVMGADGRVARMASHQQGHFAASLESVRASLAGFPAITYVKGWLPGSLALLPEKRWSFVHIDVDLYEPTLGALEYFYPRMLPGGVIVNDDFSSPMFPGGGRAWIEFFDRIKAPYVVLDTGQSIYMKPAA